MVLFPLMKPELKQLEEAACDIEMVDIEATYGALPSKEDVDALAKKYLKDTYRHCLDVANVMKYFAKKLGQNEHLRYTAGFLHDIDRDFVGKDPSKHMGADFDTIVGEIKLPSCLMDDIKSHYTAKTSVAVSSLLRRYLVSVDELT